MHVTVEPGVHDLSEWRRLKERFGESLCRMSGGESTRLKVWDHRAALRKGLKFDLYVRPEVGKTIEERYKQFEDEEKFAKELSDASE